MAGNPAPQRFEGRAGLLLKVRFQSCQFEGGFTHRDDGIGWNLRALPQMAVLIDLNSDRRGIDPSPLVGEIGKAESVIVWKRNGDIGLTGAVVFEV